MIAILLFIFAILLSSGAGSYQIFKLSTVPESNLQGHLSPHVLNMSPFSSPDNVLTMKVSTSLILDKHPGKGFLGTNSHLLICDFMSVKE